MMSGCCCGSPRITATGSRWSGSPWCPVWTYLEPDATFPPGTCQTTTTSNECAEAHRDRAGVREWHAAVVCSPEGSDPVDQVARLWQLRRAGVLRDDEYERLKARAIYGT